MKRRRFLQLLAGLATIGVVPWLFRRRTRAPLENTESLRAAIQKDFDTGNTVIVDGWLVSRTEADLADRYR